MARKAKKVMSQTFTLERFLTKINKEEIRSDQDVQRLSGQFNAAMINELIVTVLTDDYIPEIILGEEARTNQAWIIDGLQRSSSLANFRFGNYKITSAIEDSEIEYERQSRDASGKVRRDADGNIIWETAIFDIRDKTYGELPDELKDQFNEYQLKTVIHQDCTMKQISKLVRRYNNHTGMNAMQKAFTYIDNYARNIRMLSEHRFFKDCGTFTEREHTRGIYNRVVCESVMAMFHMEQWKSSPKALCSYLNQYGTEEEFRSFGECLIVWRYCWRIVMRDAMNYLRPRMHLSGLRYFIVSRNPDWRTGSSQSFWMSIRGVIVHGAWRSWTASALTSTIAIRGRRIRR